MSIIEICVWIMSFNLTLIVVLEIATYFLRKKRKEKYFDDKGNFTP